MRLHSAFTLIEVLVSVVLISIVVLGIVKIREQNIAAAHYLSSRMQQELGNSLFLGKEVQRFSGEEKDAYALLRDLGIKRDKTREVLRGIRRTIRVSSPLPIGELPLPVELRAIILRGEYPARYYRLMY